MHLFIDTVSAPAHFILFDSERNIVAQESREIKGRESERFLASLSEFLAANGLEFRDLQGAVVVNGPWAFTAMRIVTLTVNTLSFVHRTPLYGIDYFELGALSGWGYPMLLKANRGEYLIRDDTDSAPRLVALADISAGAYCGIGDVNDFTNAGISIQSEIRYATVCQNLSLTPNPSPRGERGEKGNVIQVERIEPIYIKKPNIT